VTAIAYKSIQVALTVLKENSLTSLEKIFVRYFNFLESKGKTFNIVLGVGWTAFFGTLDILAPGNASFAFLYLLWIGL
jgi:hypothetical protein